MNKKVSEKEQKRNGVHKKGIHEKSQNPKLEAALEFTKRGWYIIPLCWPDAKGNCACPKKHKKEKEVGKAPILGKDYQHFRATQEQIRLWWEKWPDANLGVLLEPSGLMVVEIDSPEAFEEVRELGIPKTLTNCSSKGYHYIFERPENFPTTRSTQRGKSKAIDLLSSGYANLPPSTHKSGHTYHFELDLPLAKAPKWVKWMLDNRTLLKESKKVEEAQRRSITANFDKTEEEKVEDALQYISAEHYDDWLHVGMALHWWDFCGDGGTSGRYIWDKWSRTSPKFDPKDQETKWSSFKPGKGITLGTLFDLAKDNGWNPPKKEHIQTKHKSPQSHTTTTNTNPKQVYASQEEEQEDLKTKLFDFPLTVFPTALRDIVEAYAESMNASVDIAATYALTAGAIALGPNWKIESKGFCRSPRIWVAVVAPPGSAKTPVLQAMLEPIDRREKYLRDRWQQQLRLWEDQRKEKEDKEELSRPIQYHVKTDDFNIDSLISTLSTNPEGLILDVDELTQLFGLIETSHTGGKGRARGSFLSMWSGKPISIVRKRSDDLYVENPFVVVCGGTQPDIIRTLELSQGDGMVQRFLWSCPNLEYKERGYGTPLPEGLRYLWNQKIEETFGNYQGLFQASHEATLFGNEALKTFNQQSNELNKAGISAFAALYAKAPDYLHRLSALLFGFHQMFEHQRLSEVPKHIFFKAYELTEYFLQHSKHCINLMLSNKSERKLHQELAEKDRLFSKKLKILIAKTGGGIRTASEWGSLLKENLGVTIETRKLGLLFKRLSSLPQFGLVIKRSTGEKTNLRYWEITEQNSKK